MSTLSRAGIFLLSPFIAFLALAPDATAGESPEDRVWTVSDKGPHYRIWEQNTADGTNAPTIRKYIELATGMYYKDQKGQWRESREEIEVVPQGGAAATHGQHKVYFPPDIYGGKIQLITPDGQELLSRPLGMSYFDGTNSVLFAELTNSIGQILPSGNQIIYTNCFSGLTADLLLTYKRSGFESDVIIRERPPEPDNFGLAKEVTRMEMLTEFFDGTIEPTKETHEPNTKDQLADATLVFGKMQMVRGYAFELVQTGSQNRKEPKIPVYKSYERIENRNFLIEAVPYKNLEHRFAKLSKSETAGLRSTSSRYALNASTSRRLLPLAPMTDKATNSIQFARADLINHSGVVLDYVTVNTSLSDFTFEGGTTYLVSDPVYTSGTTTIEAGAVIKYDLGGSITILGGVDCQTTAHNPAVLTSSGDTSIGDSVPSSGPCTNSFTLYVSSQNQGFLCVSNDSLSQVASGPFGYSSADEFTFDAVVGEHYVCYFFDSNSNLLTTVDIWPVTQSAQVELVNDGIIYYAADWDQVSCPPSVGLFLPTWGAELHDLTFKNLGFGISLPDSGTFTLNNLQFFRCGRAVDGASRGGNYLIATNLLMKDVDLAFAAAVSGDVENFTFDRGNFTWDTSLNFTNSVFVTVNGFPGTTNSHVVALVDDQSVFESGPLGDHYLSSGSGLIDAGICQASAVGLYHFTTQTNQTKEGSSTVDLGFHYVALNGSTPSDTDHDGTADYLEDENGNGASDSGESPWNLAITLQPLDKQIQVGGNVMFLVTAAGTEPFAYQWKHDGTNILSATNRWLFLFDVAATDVGLYSVTVSNPTVSVNSSNAQLTVCVPSFSSLPDLTVTNGAGSVSVLLTNISDGCDPRRVITFFASSSDTNLIPTPNISYTNLNSTGILTFVSPASGTGEVTISVVLSDNGNTNAISGEVAFFGGAQLNKQINTATAYTNFFGPLGPGNGAPSVGGWQTGTYAVISNNTPGQFSPFSFDPPQLPFVLWIVTNGTTLYSFEAYSLAIDIQAYGFLNMNGIGIAHITGFEDTPGTWSVASTGNPVNYSTVTFGALSECGTYSRVTNTFKVTVMPPASSGIDLAWLYPLQSNVFILSPTNIPMAVVASNATGDVEFLNGTNSLGVGIAGTNSLYTLLWTNVAAGNYLLTAKATNSTSIATNAIAIVVNAMPVVSITSPTNLQSFLEVTNITITANANDPDGTITNIAFYSGTNFIGNDTSPPYSIVWSGRTNDSYPVVAVATDNRGAITASSLQVFNVTPTNPLPQIAITWPTNNAVFASGADITITAVTNGVGTITNVEFFVNGQRIGSDPNTLYSITECCWKPGIYILMGQAIDERGRVVASTRITFTVANDLSTPGEGFWDPLFANPGVDPFNPNWAYVMALRVHGSDLYACLNAYYINDLLVDGLAKWNGTNWESVGYRYSTVVDVAVDGEQLYAACHPPSGDTKSIAQWNGASWSQLGNQIDQFVNAVTLVGADVYIGGDFTSTDNGAGTNVQYIAKLNKTTSLWEPVGNGLNGPVHVISAVGNRLFVGGSFTNAGGNPNANGIAELVGNVWTNVGAGVSGTNSYGEVCSVYTLAACADDLFVGGDFTSAGGNTNAVGIAKWDGKEWTAIQGGVAGDDDIAYPDLTVYSVSTYGGTLFVGGAFKYVVEGTNRVPVNHIAKAVWNEGLQTWMWASLDQGVLGNVASDWVSATAILPGSKPDAYDLYVGGNFSTAGEAQTISGDLARWRLGTSYPTNAPSASIVAPLNGTIFTNPASINLVATAAPNDVEQTITSVEFRVDGESLGAAAPDLDGSYSLVWDANSTPPLSLGVHMLMATATDSTPLKITSKPVFFTVTDSNPDVISNNDVFTVFANSAATSLPVLANDVPASGLKIAQASQAFYPARLGNVSIASDGASLLFTPFPYTFGTNFLWYSVTNSSGTVAEASAVVFIRVPPIAHILSPDCSSCTYTSPISNMMLSGGAYDWDGIVTNVTLFTNGVECASVVPTGTNFSFNWSASTPGYYQLKVVARDNEGYTNGSAGTASEGSEILMNVKPSVPSSLPIAIINLSQITNVVGSSGAIWIRDGQMSLSGSAYDTNGNPVSYQIRLLDPQHPEAPMLYNVTPGNLNSQGFHEGAVTNASFGTLDLTLVDNGSYVLELVVRAGGNEAATSVLIGVDSQLKIGQFSFSEQDMVIPVNGIPLTVIRTYNSLNPRTGDFGFNWTYALNDLDVLLDEERTVVTALDTLDDGADLPSPAPFNFSLRTGGGRNVTLTLPDGRRTTFLFTLVPSAYNDPGSAGLYYDAKWIAPPGVTETLTTPNPTTHDSLGDNTLVNLFPPLKPFWRMSVGMTPTPIDAYDFPALVLSNRDGTRYEISRDVPGAAEAPEYIYIDEAGYFGDSYRAYTIKPHSGKPKLRKITQRSGDSIVINDNNISHYNATNALTRTVLFERDGSGRITALRDPNSGSNGLPSVKYVYNRDTGNLIWVQRLVDRAAGTYTTTKYHYDNPKFPHYITSIEDPRGIPLARNEYDDSGKLTAVVDADGKRTEFTHSISNKLEGVVDRLNHTNSFTYDLRGNVTATTNAAGGVTLMAYDDNNNKTNEVVYLNGLPYATNRFSFSADNLLLASFNPLGYSNTFVYGSRGQLLISTDARGISSTNYYDANTDQLIATADTLGHGSTNVYDGRGLLVGSVDAIGTVTTNFFDSMGNLTGSATLSGSTVLSTNTFGYDLNGNRTNSTVWRRVAGVWTAATTTFVYDGQNRVVQTIDPDGGTNTVVYNSLGKQESTIDKLGRVTSYSYDYQGRLMSTTYPDLSTESSAYDAAGNRASSTDRGGRTTSYYYDALNRLTQTVYADNTTNRTVYDDLSRVQFTVDARGTTNAFGYDVLGRRLAVTNAWGTSVAMVSRFGFDENGNQVTVTNVFGNAAQTVTTSVYDTLNRQWQTLFADGTKTSTAFDVLGRRLAETNQDNIVTWFAYDGVGRLAAVTNALNKVTTYEYDEVGNLLRQIDALNRTNRFEYDAMGRRTKRVLGGDQTETLSYDLAGNLIRQTNFNSVVITNQYDVLNRLTNRSSISGYQIAYTYTATGQRQSMTDASGTTVYAYDIRNRLLTNTAPAGILSYRYDANGNVTNITSSTASGTRITYQYDPLNRLTNVVDAGLTGTQNTSYRFDGIGNLQSYTYPNGVTNRYTYDSLSRLTNLTWKLTTTALADFSYKLNLGGTRTNLTETVNGTSYTNRWGYDALYRLTNDVLLATSGSGTNAYTYDDVGNRLSRTVSGFGSPVTASTNQSFNFDKGDRLDNDSNAGTASTMFDANGNTLSYSGTFQYDVENRLTNANNGAVLIVYNGDGQRVKKVTPTKTTLYLIDSRNPSGYAQVLEELTVSGGTTNLACAYTYGLDLISQRQPGVVTNFYGYDGHGSVRFLLTLAGGISDTYVYDAYGKQLNASGSTLNNYRYTGEQFDSDLGFYYLRARYLDPNIGRFQTMDSYGGKRNQPMSLHKFIYCSANPINSTDPSGHNELTLNGQLLVAGGTLALATALWTPYAIKGPPPMGSIGRPRMETGRGRTSIPEEEPVSQPPKAPPTPVPFPTRNPAYNYMRLQLQDDTDRKSQDGNHYWSTVLENRSQIGVTVLQVREGLRVMHEDVNAEVTEKDFPNRVEPQLYSSIIRFSQKLDSIQAGGGVTQIGNVLREKFSDAGIEYRIDLENLQGHNLRR